MAGVYDAPVIQSAQPATEADLRAIGRSLWNKKALILGPTLLAAAAALFISGSMTPQYRSEARVLVQSNDTVYTRPEGTQLGEQRDADELEVQSQVQLLLSRDLAREVVNELKLGETEEFDAAEGDVSLARRVMILLGLSRDPMRLNAEERVLDAYYEHLGVYAVPGSRVIVVEFSSSNPEIAANVANTVTQRYLELQQTTKQASTRRASTWLASQIEELSGRVADAEAKVEDFRTKSNLFLGSNNSTITTQQLGELNSELARVRAQEADARAKAQQIRDTLKSGRPIESLDLANSELIRGLSQQRISLAAAIAREGRTYLPGHPRMKELQAQIGSLDSQIKSEASKLARAYENEADLSAGRVASVQSTIDTQKEVVGSAGGQEVQLRALEREAKAQRDLLEQFLARYRDAAARERVEAIPPDARIISRATPTNTPYSPKPLAITALTALGVFVLLVVAVTASEFMIAPSAPGAPLISPDPIGPRRRPDPVDAEVPGPTPETPVEKTETHPARADAPPATADANTPTPVFGKLGAQPGETPRHAHMDIEAADMRMLGDLATHLASMPKGEGALNILTLASAADVDAGRVALSLARSLAGAGRKAIVVDAASGSRDFAAALPNPGEGGLGELIAGSASFGQAIQRDRASAAHLIGSGAEGLISDKTMARIGVVFDALGLTYDFVIALAPAMAGEPSVLAGHAGAAILVAHQQDAVATAAHEKLVLSGIGDVILLLSDATRAQPAERAS